MDHLIWCRRRNVVFINKNGAFCFVNFAVLVDHKVKTEERESIDEYLDPARVLRELLNIKVTVIPIVIGTL